LLVVICSTCTALPSWIRYIFILLPPQLWDTGDALQCRRLGAGFWRKAAALLCLLDLADGSGLAALDQLRGLYQEQVQRPGPQKTTPWRTDLIVFEHDGLLQWCSWTALC